MYHDWSCIVRKHYKYKPLQLPNGLLSAAPTNTSWGLRSKQWLITECGSSGCSFMRKTQILYWRHTSVGCCLHTIQTQTLSIKHWKVLDVTDSGFKSTLSFSLCCLGSWVSWASAPKHWLDKIHDKVRSDEKSWMYHCIYFNVIDISCGSLAGHCCWAVSSLWLYFGSIDREMQHNVSVTGQIWAPLNLTLFVYSRRSQSFHKQLRPPVDRSDCQH